MGVLHLGQFLFESIRVIAQHLLANAVVRSLPVGHFRMVGRGVYLARSEQLIPPRQYGHQGSLNSYLA